MKILKSRILLVIVTVILTGSISVYAAGRYYATQVDYEPSNPNFNVDNMSDALDELYDKTKNYKNLSTPTDVEANYLLNGKKAYKSNGTLVTGSIPTYSGTTNITASSETQTLQTNGKYMNSDITIEPVLSSEYIVNGDFVSFAGDNTINIGFVPKKVIVINNNNGRIYMYDRNLSTNHYIYISDAKRLFYADFSGNYQYYFDIESGELSQYNNNLTNYFKSIGNNTVIHLSSNIAGTSFSWSAYR
ncbi:MAG: hypothetical protein E7158_05035 [Firmicutes bacterium]|nr:hypothetical protein [Bacillota bacterium]